MHDIIFYLPFVLLIRPNMDLLIKSTQSKFPWYFHLHFSFAIICTGSHPQTNGEMASHSIGTLKQQAILLNFHWYYLIVPTHQQICSNGNILIDKFLGVCSFRPNLYNKGMRAKVALQYLMLFLKIITHSPKTKLKWW